MEENKVEDRLEVNPVLEGLTVVQLKDTIIRKLYNIDSVKRDAKATATASRAAVKDMQCTVQECLQLINDKEA